MKTMMKAGTLSSPVLVRHGHPLQQREPLPCSVRNKTLHAVGCISGAYRRYSLLCCFSDVAVTLPGITSTAS